MLNTFFYVRLQQHFGYLLSKKIRFYNKTFFIRYNKKFKSAI